MNADLRPMSLGEILDRTFQIYRAKFLVFAGIAALPALAMMGIHCADDSWLHLSSLVRPANRGGDILWSFIVKLGFYHVSSLMSLLILPATTELASEVTLGGNGTILSSLRFAATRWRIYLWVAVLKVSAQLVIPEFLIAVLMLGVALVGVVTGLIKSGAGFLTFFVIVVFAAGCFLFVWLGACFSLAIPACALERIAGVGALRRSWSLSKGSRFRVAFTWLMVSALSFLMMVAVQYLSLRLVVYFCHGHQLGVAAEHFYVETEYLLYAAVSAFVSPIYSVALTLIYYDQRIRKEGYDIERMMDAAGLNAPATPPATDGTAPPAETEEAQA